MYSLPPPRTLIMDFTMTHVRFGCSHLHPLGQLTHTRSSDGPPDPDGILKETVRIKIRHYPNVYLNRPDPIAFLPLAVDTSDHFYDDFIRFLFLCAHRATSIIFMFVISYSPLTLSNISSLNLGSNFRCTRPPCNSVFPRRLDPSIH